MRDEKVGRREGRETQKHKAAKARKKSTAKQATGGMLLGREQIKGRICTFKGQNTQFNVQRLKTMIFE